MTRRILDLDTFVPGLITFISNKISTGASNTYRKLFGIGLPEWRVLAVLAVEPNITAYRICQIMGFDKALASRTIQKLQAHGHVKMEVQGRQKLITLSKQGYLLHDRILQVAVEREEALLGCLTRSERKQLTLLLQRLHARVVEVNDQEASISIRVDGLTRQTNKRVA